jgi:hypothetical protein
MPLTGGPSGYGGYLGGGYDYGMSRPVGPSAKMAMLMGYNHLNTIEEEKHETQTSNYFKEGDSERDDSKHMNNTNILAKGSRILDEDMYLEQSESNKHSPNRNEDYNFNKR